MILKRYSTLYKKNLDKSISFWDIWVTQDSGDSYRVKTGHGRVGGKYVEDEGKIVNYTKNEGKVNQRSPKEQAIAEADARYTKALESGYFLTLKEAQDSFFIAPMLANEFYTRGSKVNYPVIAQRKYDGIRCIASVDIDGTVWLVSRGGKVFPFLQHIKDELVELIPPGVYFDGELYSHELSFQKITSIVRRTAQPSLEERSIMYRVYDCILTDSLSMGFAARWGYMQQRLIENPRSHITIVENRVVNNRQELFEYHQQVVSEGYEGAMVRNPYAAYGLGSRCDALLKLKSMKDEEFKIVGYREATGNDIGTVLWLCETTQGNKFWVRPRGTREERAGYLRNGELYIGKSLTVRFQEYTDDGVPRFPVGIAIRDYE